MKSAFFLLVNCLIVGSLARPPVFLGYQDSLGQYSFGYSAPGSARSEVRTSNGATRGTYSYVDETGVIQTAQYVADGENGFRIIATNLPQAPLPVQDTPEVMAARTAHLQALEMAARRDDKIQNNAHDVANAQERKIQGNQDNTVPREQVKPENPSRKKEQLAENAQNVESRKDESLEAAALKSDTVKEKKTDSDAIREKFTGVASQKIIDGAKMPEAVPLISSHVLLPQVPNQRTVPIYRISHGDHEIEPSSIPESAIAQGTSGMFTPAGTALKSGTALSGEAVTLRKEQTQHTEEQVESIGTVIVPFSIIPLSSSHSSFVRYVSPTSSLHYAAYDVL